MNGICEVIESDQFDTCMDNYYRCCDSEELQSDCV